MRIWKGFKREICMTDWRICTLLAVSVWIVGCASFLLSGASVGYHTLCKPSLAPRTIPWMLLWMGYYLLLGIALGLVIGRCSCCSKSLFRKGFIYWCLFLICSLLWTILFFSAGFQITAFILIVLSICFGCCTIIPFATESLLSACLLIICIWWQLYNFLLTLLLIFWN